MGKTESSGVNSLPVSVWGYMGKTENSGVNSLPVFNAAGCCIRKYRIETKLCFAPFWTGFKWGIVPEHLVDLWKWWLTYLISLLRPRWIYGPIRGPTIIYSLSSQSQLFHRGAFAISFLNQRGNSVALSPAPNLNFIFIQGRINLKSRTGKTKLSYIQLNRRSNSGETWISTYDLQDG